MALVLALGCGASPPPAPIADLDAGPPPSTANADADEDGVADADDACPCAPEDIDGWGDDDGCPEPDNDEDRIPDACDVCPNEAEVYNGNCDEDGCPDLGHAAFEEPIQIVAAVWFAPGASSPLAQSEPLLAALALTLVAHPEIRLVAVLGQASRSEASRQGLARARADAVLEALVLAGVDRRRLVAEVDGASDRRVHFEVREADEPPPLGPVGPAECLPRVCPAPSTPPPSC